MTSFISVSQSLFNIAVSSYWPRLWFPSWNRNGQSQKEFRYEWKFGAEHEALKSECLCICSTLFFCSPSLYPVLVEDQQALPAVWTHLHFRVSGSTVRHSEDPPLMFQRSAARLHNFPASVAGGAKALNCCLEILSGS